ncbi:MAG: hypothetical protein Q4B45_10510 [Coriobacteriia bacterium]|nr:hypothetical protein [Coriobacteriia bacterium]
MRARRGRLAALAALGVLAAVLGLLARVAGAPAASGAGSVSLQEAAQEELAQAPEVDAQAQSLAEGLLDVAGARVSASALDVPEASAEVLEGYAARSDCALGQAGYLDVTGNAWGCVVLGDDWAEVCVVSADEEGSEVRTWRLSQGDVEGRLCP